MEQQFKYDVFLSYNSKDRPRVRRLALQLKNAGLQVWFDEWNVLPGDIIALKIDEGLDLSRVLLLCISANALASGWVAMERSTAIHRDASNAYRRFIPLLLNDCELPDTLRRYKYVDFRKESTAVLKELVSVCKSNAKETQLRVSSTSKKNPNTDKSKPKKLTKIIEPLAILESRLEGHSSYVYSFAFGPDGSWLASSSADKSVRIWNIITGQCVQTFADFAGRVLELALTPDGNRLICGTDDNTIHVFDIPTGNLITQYKHHNTTIRSIAVLPNGEDVLSCSDKQLRLWDIASGRLLCGFEFGEESLLYCAVVYNNGKLALTGNKRGSIFWLNLETGDVIMEVRGHSSEIYDISVTPDEKFAISGSADTTIKIWDLVSGEWIGTLEGHKAAVNRLAISPDSKILASISPNDYSLRIWDLHSGHVLQVVQVIKKLAPIAIEFNPDGSHLVVGTALSPFDIQVYRLNSILTSTSVEATRRYVNAKVVLLGEGMVGKTSLAYRLIDDKYVVSDRTHGMNVWRLDLPQIHKSASLAKKKEKVVEEREALLWDLAGQEDYRLIHRLFLEEIGLALLLINPQKDDPFAEASDWLKALKPAANNNKSKREAVRLLIFSQIDVGGMKLSNAKIDRFSEQYGFHSWLPTSSKTGENCSDKKNNGRPSKLKQLIAEYIPWDKLPWTSTPRLLNELKNAIVAMRDMSDIRLIRFAELAQRLEQALPNEKFDEPDVRTAVTLLANHGLVRALKFGDLVLLQPELINGYAGAIIRAARAHTDEIGCVLETDIYQPKFDFTGVKRLKHHPDEELLLRALVQTFLDHSLCIAEDTQFGRQLVFPSQYRREKDIPHEPDIFVSYTFSGEWQTVWTTLVVRLWYSNEFGHRELWRNAAEFSSAKGHILGLKIDNHQGEGTGTISLYFDQEVPDELKAIFIEYVHRHLANYGCDVTRDRHYICPVCAKPVIDLVEVRKRLASKKNFIYCQGCDEKVPLIDFIEQRLKSDPIAFKILAMEETTTKELDTQALEQILIGHMMAIAGEANQIFRPMPMFDYGIDGEVEFKDDDGKASGKKIYVQLKSGKSYLRTRKSDGNEVFDMKDDRHLKYWIHQPVDVYLVIRHTDGATGEQTIRWMNITRYLKERKDKKSRQIIFNGQKLDMEAVWKVRDEFFPTTGVVK